MISTLFTSSLSIIYSQVVLRSVKDHILEKILEIDNDSEDSIDDDSAEKEKKTPLMVSNTWWIIKQIKIKQKENKQHVLINNGQLDI